MDGLSSKVVKRQRIDSGPPNSPPRRDGDQEESSNHDTWENTYNEEELDRMEGSGIEPFNLAAEKELGKFDEDGNFSWTRKDLEEDGDKAWLEQVGDSIAHIKTGSATDDSPVKAIPAQHAFAILAVKLKPKETSLKALRRLTSDAQTFAAVTEACDALLNSGISDVYIMTREDIRGRLKMLRWMYRVRGQSETHGYFDADEMQDWREQGFFREDSEELCDVRAEGTDQWLPAENIQTFFSIYSSF